MEREAKSKKQQVEQNKDEHFDILVNLFFPLKDKLLRVLEPAKTFFRDEKIFCSVIKNGIELAWGDDNWTYKSLNIQDKNEMIKALRSIDGLEFYYHLNGVKPEYEAIDADAKIRFRILFKDHFYTVSSLGDKPFIYGTYPTEEEINDIVASYKAYVLEKIKQSTGK